MSGMLIAVVGPSGAGKDTLIDTARTARPDIFFPTRVITRPSDAGGEVFQSVDPAVFTEMAEKGDFAFHWQAHGLQYGIPIGINAALADGRHVMFNGSRGIIELARQRYDNLRVLVITAPQDVLAQRLAARGREDGGDIARRLKRSGYAVPEGADIRVICNDVPLAQARAKFLAALPPCLAPNRQIPRPVRVR